MKGIFAMLMLIVTVIVVADFGNLMWAAREVEMMDEKPEGYYSGPPSAYIASAADSSWIGRALLPLRPVIGWMYFALFVFFIIGLMGGRIGGGGGFFVFWS